MKNNQVTVQQLKKTGAKVTVKHFRWASKKQVDKYIEWEFINLKKDERKLYNISGRGGATEVKVELKDGRVLEGLSKCHINDNFNKKIAILIALGRALKGQEIGK